MNQHFNKKISEALGMDPIPSPLVTKPVESTELTIQQQKEVASVAAMEVIKAKDEEEHIVDQDFEEARDNLKKIIEKSTEAIENLQMLALESESARHYEVLAALLKRS